MPLFRVDQAAERLLIKQAESGLGYQIVRYHLGLLVVFNATVAIPLSELWSRKFSTEDYFLLSGSHDPISYEPLKFIDEFVVVFSQLDPKYREDIFGLSFSVSSIEPPEQVIPSGVNRSYYRYGAYNMDKRVKPNGDFVPGTYATTYADMHFVPSGFAAVGRYALPNPASAHNIFTIITSDRPTLIGTATPNFGQAGGGVEVLFSNGAVNTPGASFSIDIG